MHFVPAAAMLAVFFLPVCIPVSVAAGALPTPAQSPSAQSTLRLIGRVHATTSLCRSALEHANVGIKILVENDARIADSTSELRHAGFDKNVLTKENALQYLREGAALIAKQASEGNATMKELKAEAVAATSDSQRHDLLVFQESLDGALMRQKRLADHLGRMVVYLDNHQQIDADTRADLELQAVVQQSFKGAYHDPKGPFHQVPDSLDTVAGTVADELDRREQDVQTDEGTAADRIDSAFAKC